MMIFMAIVLGFILGFVFGYNRLVQLKSMVQEAWSGIDVQLKRRYDLIPSLLDIVKGYASHEKNIFEEVVKLRTASMGATDIKNKEKAELGFASSLKTLFAVAEQYPDLKSNTNFLSLQKELSSVEEELQFARRYYNGSVRNYNMSIQKIPLNLIAAMLGFKLENYFDINVKERDVPSTKF